MATPPITMHDTASFSALELLESPPDQCARQVGLHYHGEELERGLHRRRVGRGFVYTNERGQRVQDPRTLKRIRALAIPPAWTRVWISYDPKSHLQATGYDARGRKQYRYHASFRQAREAIKFASLTRIAALLPRLRARVARSLVAPGSERERVLAALVRILDLTGIRVGNEEYARRNGSHGLTTLGPEHAKVSGRRVTLAFRGKSKQAQRLEIEDRAVATVVRACRGRHPKRLFAWVDAAGKVHPIHAGDVNEYLQSVVGVHLTAKEIRTWLASVRAADHLRHQAPLKPAICAVAAAMGHTPAVCKRSYIHPAILEAHRDDALDPLFQRARRLHRRHLSVAERAVALLVESH